MQEQLDNFLLNLEARIASLPPLSQKILRGVPDTGITALIAAEVAECNPTGVYKHLTHLVNSGFLVREIDENQYGKFRSRYSYFFQKGISSSLIKLIFKGLDSKGKTIPPTLKLILPNNNSGESAYSGKNESQLISSLPFAQLLILQALNFLGEVGSGAIKEFASLSKSTFKTNSDKLLRFKYINRREIITKESSYNSEYIYSLASSIQVQVVEDALLDKLKNNQKLVNPILMLSLERDLSENLKIFINFKKRIFMLPKYLLSILKIVPDEGIPTKVVAAKLKCNMTNAYINLNCLVEEGWLVKEKELHQSISRVCFVYYLSSGINHQLINALLSPEIPCDFSNFGVVFKNCEKNDSIQISNQLPLGWSAGEEIAPSFQYDSISIIENSKPETVQFSLPSVNKFTVKEPTSIDNDNVDNFIDLINKYTDLMDSAERLEAEIRQLFGVKADQLIVRIKSGCSLF